MRKDFGGNIGIPMESLGHAFIPGRAHGGPGRKKSMDRVAPLEPQPRRQASE